MIVLLAMGALFLSIPAAVYAIPFYDTWDVQISPPANYIGNWSGNGTNEIGVAECKLRTIAFNITIDADGHVTGFVGDAVITDGEFQRTAWYLRMFGREPFRIIFRLKGPIVAAEKFTRDSGSLYIGTTLGDHFPARFVSDTWQLGGESVVMPVNDILLAHVY